MNLYKEGNITHYNQKLENCTMQRCWIECLAFSNYQERLADVQKFNRYALKNKRNHIINLSMY